MKIRQQVTASEDDRLGGLYRRRVYGLNIFLTNLGSHETQLDPIVSVFQGLSAQACAAHIGTLALEGDTPNHAFAPEEGRAPYQLTRLGLYRGRFYLGETALAGCVLPPTALT